MERQKLTTARAIVECIKRERVRHVFCVPGESYLPVLDAFYDESSIELISARHESGAGFMAEGYAKASFTPGVVFATRGVGASNLAIAIHTAYQDSTPMVVFLGQVSSKFRGREGFQEVDLDQYLQPISKWAVELRDPERTPELVQRAFRIAKSGRPGPVVISLPEDVLPEEAVMQFAPVTPVPRPAPSNKEINRVKELLLYVKKPLIIAGGGVKSAHAEDVLVSFAEKWGIPVMAAFRRQDVFPNDHPLYVGHLGLGTPKEILQTVREADTILAIGTRLSEVTTQDYSIITADKKLIHMDISYETIGKVFAPDVGIVADIREALALLNRNTSPKSGWQKWVEDKRKAFELVSDLKVSDNDSIHKHVISILEEKLSNDSLLTNDAGNFAGWLHRYYPFRKKHTYIGPTSGAMGYGMPAALGAKLALPKKQVVSLSGDGGFIMTAQDLETAVRYNIPVICLVFNNSMYGTIRMHQEIHFPKKVIGTDLGSVSFKDLAGSMGVDAFQVATSDAFKKALDDALKRKGPVVIEILTDKEQISVSSTISQIRKR
ncbi:acetolactate synthase [Oceanobacillus halophilus]|uniref:Acetolactate synthase n=1 Tax=Oceanobacillus halophilus TaxID=930130 RepID=A0A494ZXJ6_9BACI|nr:thiamine pyrophosphate-dependent enzyme [Oceanobacillus halophilus]RKQ31419.1 acetolactate synthase [Oceanobacillus halophilus]